MSVVISNKCTWTIGDPKPARTSLYDGTEPVILLRLEDVHANLNHQPCTVSYIWKHTVITMTYKL